MKILLGIAVAIVAGVIFYACKTPTQAPAKQESTTDVRPAPRAENGGKESPVIMSLKRGACRGTCKMYEALITADGTVLYQGKRNVPKVGAYKGKLDEQTLNSLKRTFESMNFSDLEDEYIAEGIADLQKMTISYMGKTIKYHNRKASDELKAASDKIDAALGSIRWETNE